MAPRPTDAGVALETLQRVPVEERPFNAETPMQALAGPLTPTSLFYVRNHFDVPRLDPAEWRLAVEGEVERPLEISLDELRTLPEHTLAVTLECAGNGRTSMSPPPPGTPWAQGAVSTARFMGTPFRHLLDRSRPRPGAGEVVFTGADRGEVQPGRLEPFARSLPLELAHHPDTLLAWAMNDEPLAPEHGAPLRLVVPRWYGVASVKWLVRIRVQSDPFEGYFQKERYVYARDGALPDGTPVTFMRVRAVIARPADGARVPVGPVEVAGTAWSGAAPVRRVQVSADGGRSWSEAEVGEPVSSYASAPWSFRWCPPGPGAFTLAARATDGAGNTQPREPVWNEHGYGNNAVHRIRIELTPA